MKSESSAYNHHDCYMTNVNILYKYMKLNEGCKINETKEQWKKRDKTSTYKQQKILKQMCDYQSFLLLN